jgi:hypothetical protein
MTMALVDPYSPCPCGSDKKFKWCCQKVEPYVERALRLAANGQNEAAIAALDEGLAKVPDNPWMLLRKSLLLIEQQQPAEARQCVANVLKHHPEHLGAAVLQVRLVLATEGPVAAAAQFQQALLHTRSESRSRLGKIAAIVGEELAKQHLVPASLRHLELAAALDDSAESVVRSAYQTEKTSPAISPWLKEPLELAGPPEQLSEEKRDQFKEALDGARQGLWQSAAASFELLSADPAARLAAERNLGLCRLWLGDEEGASTSLRRWLDGTSPTTEAVDLAVICQMIDDTMGDEPIEYVRLTWALRDKGALERALVGQATIVDLGLRHLDVEDEESPEVAHYLWLDRPPVLARSGLSREHIPLVRADLLIGDKSVMLEAHDDGGLDGLIDDFTVLAGRTIPPAHPRTTLIGQTDRARHAMSWHWHLPPELADAEKRRLTFEQIAHYVREVWPRTPRPSFGGRTPQQLAQSGKSEALLRGAVLALELSGEYWTDLVDWPLFRAKLGIAPEPAIDPETVEISRVPLGRLALVPLARLDDDRLVAIYQRAHEWGLNNLLPAIAREIVSREGQIAQGKIEAVLLYGDLALEAVQRRDRDAALLWIRRGRAAEDPGLHAEFAPQWDMMELQIKAQFDKPDEWVPELAAILERYRNTERASLAITARLIEMGLLRLVSPPDRPGEISLDSRGLQQLLSLYGPKVTTAAGYLGVSATKGEIWTPGSEAKGSPIWTPGSDAAAGEAEKPRIIVTGR